MEKGALGVESLNRPNLEDWDCNFYLEGSVADPNTLPSDQLSRSLNIIDCLTYDEQFLHVFTPEEVISLAEEIESISKRGIGASLVQKYCEVCIAEHHTYPQNVPRNIVTLLQRHSSDDPSFINSLKASSVTALGTAASTILRNRITFFFHTKEYQIQVKDRINQFDPINPQFKDQYQFLADYFIYNNRAKILKAQDLGYNQVFCRNNAILQKWVEEVSPQIRSYNQRSLHNLPVDKKWRIIVGKITKLINDDLKTSGYGPKVQKQHELLNQINELYSFIKTTS